MNERTAPEFTTELLEKMTEVTNKNEGDLRQIRLDRIAKNEEVLRQIGRASNHIGTIRRWVDTIRFCEDEFIPADPDGVGRAIEIGDGVTMYESNDGEVRVFYENCTVFRYYANGTIESMDVDPTWINRVRAVAELISAIDSCNIARDDADEADREGRALRDRWVGLDALADIMTR